MSIELDTEFYAIKAQQSNNIAAGNLHVDEKTKLFTITKVTGDWTEWRIVTYNQRRLFNQVKTSKDKEPSIELHIEFNAIIAQQSSNIAAGNLHVDEKTKLFSITKVTGGFTEWRIVTYNQRRLFDQVKTSKDEEPSIELDIEFYAIKAQQSNNIAAGNLHVDEKTKLFSITKVTGDWTEWRIVTYNQRRLFNQVKTSKDKEPSIELDIEFNGIIAQQNSNIAAGNLHVDEKTKLFSITKVTGGFTEWRIVTYNQRRLFNQVKASKDKEPCYLLEKDKEPSIELDIEFYAIKAQQSNNIAAGNLHVDEKTKLFSITKVTGDWTEWRIVTYNQRRLFNQVKTSKDKKPSIELDIEFNAIIAQQSSNIAAGNLHVDEKTKLFSITKVTGGFTEWRIVTYNQRRLFNQVSSSEDKESSSKDCIVKNYI
jgi:uncharacterized Fe-S cluster protein YjdI